MSAVDKTAESASKGKKSHLDRRFVVNSNEEISPGENFDHLDAQEGDGIEIDVDLRQSIRYWG